MMQERSLAMLLAITISGRSLLSPVRLACFVCPLAVNLAVLPKTVLAETPPSSFLARAITLAPNSTEACSQVSVADFLQRIQPTMGTGDWEADAPDNGWIYRIEREDRLARRTDSVAILFVDLPDGKVWLKRWNVNGADLSTFERVMIVYRYLTPSEKSSEAQSPSTPPSSDRGELSAAQLGAIAEHVRVCWKTNAGVEEGQEVLLTVTTDSQGTIRKAEVAKTDLGRIVQNTQLRKFAEQAIRAVTDPLCAKLPLPNSMMGTPSIITFRFWP
jgi:hypothetical protein